MPPGKRKSPFIGVKESLESPILYQRYTDISQILQEPEPAQPKENHKSLETTGNGPPAKKLKKGKLRKGKAAEVVHSMTEDVKRKAEGHRGQEELDSAPLVAETDKQALTQNLKKKKKKNKQTKTAAAVKAPSGPGNAEEAQQIRSIMGIVPGKPEARPQAASFTFGFASQEAADADGEDNVHLERANGHAETPANVDNPLPASGGPAETHQGSVDPEFDERLRRVMGQKAEPSHVDRRVFVGGMPFYYDEEQVRDYWSYCGEIEKLNVMRFPDTGRFKGIAFITFAEESGYQEALKCHGVKLDEQTIRVERCVSTGPKGRPQKNLAAQNEKHNHSDPAPKTPGYHVAYVGNVAFNANQAQLKEVFEGCEVTIVRLHTDKDTGKSKGYAHVHFADEDSLDRAMDYDGTQLLGRSLKVGYAQPKKEQA